MFLYKSVDYTKNVIGKRVYIQRILKVKTDFKFDFNIKTKVKRCIKACNVEKDVFC